MDWEKEAIINYAKSNPEQGYRRLTYMMIDDDIVAVSPSSTYRVMYNADLLIKWSKGKASSKGNGFTQPTKCHQQWHIDIKYVNFKGTFLFLISVIDGYSRYIIHHELRMSMQEFDIQLTLERALEKFPNILNKSKSIENILMVCLTPNENLRIFTGKILWRSIVAYNILNKYSKKYGAKHVYLLNFNIFQFALGIFRPNY